MTKPETNFRKRFAAFLKILVNTENFSIQQVAIRGTADIILCCNGLFVWCEIKTDSGKLTPLQEYKASCVTSKGKGIALVVRPYNFEKVKDFLILLDRGIYDKNVLRTIEFSAIPESNSKARKRTNARSSGVQNQAHSNRLGKEPERDGGEF